MHPPTQPSAPPAPAGLMQRRRVIRLAAALPWVVLAAGCGQKGPLLHPPEPDEEEEDGEDREDRKTSALSAGRASRPA